MPIIKNNVEYFSLEETELYLKKQAEKRAKIFVKSVLEKNKKNLAYV